MHWYQGVYVRGLEVPLWAVQEVQSWTETAVCLQNKPSLTQGCRADGKLGMYIRCLCHLWSSAGPVITSFRLLLSSYTKYGLCQFAKRLGREVSRYIDHGLNSIASCRPLMQQPVKQAKPVNVSGRDSRRKNVTRKIYVALRTFRTPPSLRFMTKYTESAKRSMNLFAVSDLQHLSNPLKHVHPCCTKQQCSGNEVLAYVAHTNLRRASASLTPWSCLLRCDWPRIGEQFMIRHHMQI